MTEERKLLSDLLARLDHRVFCNRHKCDCGDEQLRDRITALLSEESYSAGVDRDRAAGIYRDTVPTHPFKPPFDNCKFQYCDFPGQCKSEGKCHHPKAKT